MHPTTHLKGKKPKSTKALRKIRAKYKFPVLGNLKDRIKWRNNLNGYFKKNCNINPKFIETKKIF